MANGKILLGGGGIAVKAPVRSQPRVVSPRHEHRGAFAADIITE